MDMSGSISSAGRRAEGMSMPDEVSIADREAAAAYVAELSRNLASLAKHHGLETLSYILEMAQLEAENVTRHMNGRH